MHLLKNAIKFYKRLYVLFAKGKLQNIDESIVFSLTQDLKSNEFKKQNILKAKSFIDHVTIWPDQIFSFWKIVGNPSKKRICSKSFPSEWGNRRVIWWQSLSIVWIDLFNKYSLWIGSSEDTITR